MNFTDTILFKLFMLCIFSGIVSASTMSMGGIIPGVSMLICLFSGIFAGFVAYFEYKHYKNN